MNTILKLSTFIKSADINPSLIRSVIRGMYGWQCFKECASDIQNNGADSGFGQFIYYSDTVKFTQKNKKYIFDLIREQSESFGECGSITCFLKNFNCLKNLSIGEIEDGLYNPRSDEKTTIYNALAWYALEEITRAYCDFSGEN